MKQIDKSGNYYVAQVKGNQKKLKAEIMTTITQDKPLDITERQEKGHGRHSYWSCSVYNALKSPLRKLWPGLSRFIHIKKIVYDTKEKKHIESDRLYISNQSSCEADLFIKGIRNHWLIENLLHREKDVLHREDKNKISKGSGPTSISVISSFAINLNRKDSSVTLTDAQMRAAANPKEIICKIRT